MDLILPSFPISPTALPQIPSSQAPQTVAKETPKIEPVYTFTGKLQYSTQTDPENIKKDKNGVIKIWEDGPLLEFKIKKKTRKEKLTTFNLDFDNDNIKLTTNQIVITVIGELIDLYELMVSFYINTNQTKSKNFIIVRKGDGPKVEDNDTYSGRYIQWKHSKHNIIEKTNDFQDFTNETAANIIKESVLGNNQGSILLFLTPKKALIIELQKITKFVRRIPTTNVANRLAILEDNADMLIAKTERVVKFKRMEIALSKLKQRTQELDLIIDSNSIIAANLKKENEDNQRKLNEAKISMNNAVADQRKEEEGVLTEKAAILETLNSVSELSADMELQSMEYDGVKAKFSKCVLSTFAAFCSGLGDGQDFSGEALINRLDVIQRLVAESVYM